MNKVQELFEQLIEKYNLRAITINKETWYGINDLPIRETRKTFSDLKKQGLEKFIDDNTKLITNDIILELDSIYIQNSDVLLTDIQNSDVPLSYIRNFDKVNNAGEIFGNFKMVNFLIMNSRLGAEYKIELIEILDKIRTEGYYIDENITNEQLENLQQEINNLKEQIKYERTNQLLGATEICKLIDIEGLNSTMVLIFLEKRGLGTRIKVNKNYTFKPTEKIKDLILDGYIKVVGNQIKFYHEFADVVNQYHEIYFPILKEIKEEYQTIIDKAKENRLPF